MITPSSDSFLAERQALYFVYQRGCAACEAAEPELLAFERKFPTLLVLRLDANGPFGDRFGRVKATPTFVFQRGDQAIIRVGAVKAKELESWIKKAGGVL